MVGLVSPADLVELIILPFRGGNDACDKAIRIPYYLIKLGFRQGV